MNARFIKNFIYFILTCGLLVPFCAKAATAETDFAAQFEMFEKLDDPVDLPDFPLINMNETFYDGAKVLQGQWFIVNFWATWCMPCVLEIPKLNELDKRYEGRGLDVVYVSMNYPESPRILRVWLKHANLTGLSHMYYTNDMSIWRTIPLEGVPTTLIIGPDGKIHYRMQGDADWTSKEALAFLEQIIDNESAKKQD